MWEETLVPGRLGRHLLRVGSLVAPFLPSPLHPPPRPPQFPQPTRGLASVCPAVLAASVGPAPRAVKTGSWSGAAGRETAAHTPGSGGSRVIPICGAAPRGRGRERAGESGWAVPWRGGVRGTSANHRRPRGAGQRRCLGNTLPASALGMRPLPRTRIRGPSLGWSRLRTSRG